MPNQFKYICYLLNKSCNSKFNGNSGYFAMGGFLFLRFFCPAILAHSSFGILLETEHDSQIQDTKRKILTLVSKFIQNSLNGSSFKEESLINSTDFIKKNNKNFHKFFGCILSDVEKFNLLENIEMRHEIPQNVRDVSLAILHRFISQNKVALADELNNPLHQHSLFSQILEKSDQIGDPIPKKITIF
eukprot:Anaeramoba_ignava/a220361_12.p1 GENE.a220361_12~~a220361_12.p1  ORF type:complete len:188 (-),score=51.67 a220361_12:7-570(-)